MSVRGPRYDGIGSGYARRRREDPDLARRLRAALGDARSVLNVGAGTGSYEPVELDVVAVEPSRVMIDQRPGTAAPAVRAVSRSLPFDDRSFDAAMSVLSLHHWDDEQEAGVRELRRVARGRVVIVTVDAEVSSRMWLMADYLREVAELDRRILPEPDRVASWLGPGSRVEVVPVSATTPDHTLMSFWAHPERVLEADARAATSGFARQHPAVVERVVRDVRRDLESGVWDARHGALRTLRELDAGLRLVIGDLDPEA